MEKNVEENTEISLEEHRKIEETLSYLVRPKAKIMFQEYQVCYVFSKKEYELLITHMGSMDMIMRNTLFNIRKDLNRYASLCSKDDGVVNKIKDELDRITAVFNAYQKGSQDLLTLLGNLPHRIHGVSKIYTCMTAETYRLLILACIGYYGDMEWTRNSILRGDVEEDFTKKEDDE
jgi:hypothetical protein